MKEIYKIITRIISSMVFDETVYHKKSKTLFANKSSLKKFLYDYYYCGQPLSRINKYSEFLWDNYDKTFVKELRKSNKGKGYYVAGWKVLSRDNHSYIVRKNGINLRISRIKHL